MSDWRFSAFSVGAWQPYQRVEQTLKGSAWIDTQAGMNGRHLDHTAARCGQPIEALCLGELADRPGVRSATANPWNDVEVALNQAWIDIRPERHEAMRVELDLRVQEALCTAEEDHTYIDELFAFDARDDAHDDVIK
jgi:hypothetical protein